MAGGVWCTAISACSVSACKQCIPLESGVCYEALQESAGVCLRWALVAGSAATIMSVGMLSVAVLILNIRQNISAVGTYRIGLSMASAALVAVPFSRRTVLALTRQDDAGLASVLSEAAVLISAAGSDAMVSWPRPC
jgi:hypothetical protein